jgi:hypothetical protein
MIKRFAIVALACLISGGCWGPPSQARLDALKAEGNGILAKLEAYKARHGAYPNTLQEAGVTNIRTKYGSWKYTVRSNGVHLSVGDYGKHLFTIWWQPDKGTWYTDT